MMLLVLSDCNSETAKHRRVYDALTGKQISIPSDLYARILEDSIGVDDYYDFCIITLVDSAGCVLSKMNAGFARTTSSAKSFILQPDFITGDS